MRLTVKLSKVELKRGKDSVTGRIGLGWVTHCAEGFGLKKMVEAEYAKVNKRGIEPWKKVMSAVMMLLSGGQRVEDIEVLRSDQGLIESLGWKDMNCPDTMLKFISDIFARLYGTRAGESLLFLVLDAGNFHHPRVCFGSSGFKIKELNNIDPSLAALVQDDTILSYTF